LQSFPCTSVSTTRSPKPIQAATGEEPRPLSWTGVFFYIL